MRVWYSICLDNLYHGSRSSTDNSLLLNSNNLMRKLKLKSGSTIEFRIPIEDGMKFSLNKVWGWVHWGIRSKARNLWHEAVEIAISEYHLNPISQPVELTTNFYFKTRYLDCSNCSAMHKMIEDWMVENWIFANDTNDYIECIHLSSKKIENKTRWDMECDYVDIIIKII